ncbi:hypothetical protein NKDENANG_02241 [Candidatus Entotheonellaceae bacterium PAL068K]
MSNDATFGTILNDLRDQGEEVRARFLPGFFKAARGVHGEGDRFLGVRVPNVRKLARKYKAASEETVLELLRSEWHEARLLALLIWVIQFERGRSAERSRIFRLYIENIARVNNWDLVDLSAPKIVGAYLSDKDRSLLYEFAKHDSLWKRRISVMATYHFVLKMDEFEDALRLSEILLKDRSDLIHKASGWMLREVGKKDLPVLERFLARNLKTMPRTMLRYAIEKFPEEKRQFYLTRR